MTIFDVWYEIKFKKYIYIISLKKNNCQYHIRYNYQIYYRINIHHKI